MVELIENILLSCGAVSFGAVRVEQFAGKMSDENRHKMYSICPNVKTVFCALFPYYTNGEGNIAIYARGCDYHSVLRRRLGEACEQLGHLYPENCFVCGADSSPLPEVEIAFISGAGVLGLNGLIFCPPYGSFVFIGTIMTDRAFKIEPKIRRECIKCGECAKQCPTGALSVSDGARNFEFKKCLSYISQKRGELSKWEMDALKESPLIWGCDRCALVCPLNKKVCVTPIDEFRENLIFNICKQDVEGISNKCFLQKYSGRAFIWHGVAPLKRNLHIKEDMC